MISASSTKSLKKVPAGAVFLFPGMIYSIANCFMHRMLFSLKPTAEVLKKKLSKYSSTALLGHMLNDKYRCFYHAKPKLQHVLWIIKDFGGALKVGVTDGRY